MTKLPGAMVVIDVKREVNAVNEARKLGIPTVCLIDTDSDPDFADIPIPGNDDAMRAIEVVVQSLVAAVNEGKTARQTSGEGKEDSTRGARGEDRGGQRRSTRSKFRAEDSKGGSGGQGGGAAAEEPVAAAPAASGTTGA
jgi:small subunit ribosomal protein S2